jgi:hypothetical protein
LSQRFVVLPAAPAIGKVGQSSGDEKRQSGARARPPRSLLQSMIPKKPGPDLIRGGSRFSEKIMLQR